MERLMIKLEGFPITERITIKLSYKELYGIMENCSL